MGERKRRDWYVLCICPAPLPSLALLVSPIHTTHAHICTQILEVDVLAIDTEGFDPAVLEGASGLLSRSAVKIVMFEYHAIGLWPQTQLKDVVEKLDTQGYDVCRWWLLVCQW